MAGQPFNDSPEPGAPSPKTVQLGSIPSPRSLPAITQSVRALVLPVKRTHHYYTVIELHGSLSPAGTMRWVPQLDNILGANSTPTSTVVIKGEGARLLRYPLQLFFEVPPEQMGQFSTVGPNTCARSLTEWADCPWKGNIVVLKFNGSRRQGYKNAEDADMPTIRSFLLQH